MSVGRACQRAQVERVWAVERNVRDEFEAAVLGFIENAQRVDLSRDEKIAALEDLAELVGSVGLRKLALEIKVAPSWLSEQLKVRRDPDIFPALEEGHISVAQAAALSRAPAHARRHLLDRTVREHPEFRIVRKWVDEVRRTEKATRAEIDADLALGDHMLPAVVGVLVAGVDPARSRFAGALDVLRSAGNPATDQDMQILTAIVEVCGQLLSCPPDHLRRSTSPTGLQWTPEVTHQAEVTEWTVPTGGPGESVEPTLSHRVLRTPLKRARRVPNGAIAG